MTCLGSPAAEIHGDPKPLESDRDFIKSIIKIKSLGLWYNLIIFLLLLFKFSSRYCKYP